MGGIFRKNIFPIYNIDAQQLFWRDTCNVKHELISEKLIRKHHVLPIQKRGNRLYIAVSDPTNLQAIDDIKFQTSLRIDPVVVEQDKLEERIVKAIEAVDTTMGDLADDDFDLENLDVTGDELLPAAREIAAKIAATASASKALAACQSCRAAASTAAGSEVFRSDPMARASRGAMEVSASSRSPTARVCSPGASPVQATR